MSGKSFYDLDYIIEINEQRLEQYENLRVQYEKEINNRVSIENRLKASYIKELEKALYASETKLKNKKTVPGYTYLTKKIKYSEIVKSGNKTCKL